MRITEGHAFPAVVGATEHIVQASLGESGTLWFQGIYVNDFCGHLSAGRDIAKIAGFNPPGLAELGESLVLSSLPSWVVLKNSSN